MRVLPCKCAHTVAQEYSGADPTSSRAICAEEHRGSGRAGQSGAVHPRCGMMLGLVARAHAR
eukprot:9229555-Alexandrium_andersonii.AAC.1